MDLAAIYRDRFGRMGKDTRDRVWAVLCRSYFDDVIGPNRSVLELACGYGEFINNIAASRKLAIDINPDARSHVNDDVEFMEADAAEIPVPDASVDVVFASNFLEHLPDKATLNRVFGEVRRALGDGGHFIIMGPNIRFAYREYWDWFDHFLPLSDRSLCEGLSQAGFTIVRCTPQFLPVTMDSKLPKPDWMIRLYLAIPMAWRIFGKQFLVVARKEGGPSAALNAQRR